MYIFAKHHLLNGVVWFCSEHADFANYNLDILRLMQCPFPVCTGWSKVKTTLEIDLNSGILNIENSFSKTLRYEIRKGLKYDLIYTCTSGENCLPLARSLLIDFQAFSKVYSIGRLDPTSISYYAANKMLTISSISNNDIVHSWHIYISTNKHARLLYSFFNPSFPITPQQRSISNKTLHYHDINYFINNGFSYYDFGGWYSGKSDNKKLSINVFKKSFGGKIKTYYNVIIPFSLKGRIFLNLKKLKDVIYLGGD